VIRFAAAAADRVLLFAAEKYDPGQAAGIGREPGEARNTMIIIAL
jgi:hypothetical protein